MPVKHFGLRLNHLNINDNELLAGRLDPNVYKVYKVRPFLAKSSKIFEKCSNKCVTMDQSMIRFKGSSKFKQYAKNVCIKFGL